MKAIKTDENETKAVISLRCCTVTASPIQSLRNIIFPQNKHSKTDQRPPGNSFIDDIPYSLSTCSTTPESTKITFYIK